jgi:hypothetical protein
MAGIHKTRGNQPSTRTRADTPDPARTPKGTATSPAARADSVERSKRPAATGPVPSGNGPGRSSGVTLRNLVPVAPGVELGRNGLVVDGAGSARDAGVTRGSVGVLYEAARRTSALDAPAFKSLSAGQRARLMEQLTPFLLFDRDAKARDSGLGVKSRASSFALLQQLCASMKTADGKARAELAGILVGAAEAEKHPGLRRQMILGLEGLSARALTTADVKLRTQLTSELAPPAPPYDAWFGKDKAPEFRVRQYVMDEFYKDELANYRAMGFEVKELGKGRAVATKDLVDPTGKNPTVKARVEVTQQDANVFDAMGDPRVHAVIYSGHSQLGAVGKISMEHAPAMRGDKLVAMFACRTKQNLPSLRDEFPGAHLLVSNNGTYGHDDRLVTSALFDGIARRSSYAAMEKDAEKRGPWEKNNYLFPHNEEQWRHVDLDRDGLTDVSGGRRDVLYNVDIRRQAGQSISFKPREVSGDVAGLDGKRVSDAVAWFNTEFHYWTEDFGNAVEKKRQDHFTGDGWFKSANPDEVVRITPGEGNPPVWRVKVNAAYSHLAPDAITMMVTYELARAVTAQTRPQENAYDNRMRSLAMVGAYVNYHVEFSDTADNLLRTFAERYGFPPTLSWPVVEKAINSDEHAEASAQVVGWLEKGMQYPFLEVNPTRSSLAFRTEVQKALDVLRASKVPVAQAAFEAIVSGRVKVDTLNDLNREDFLHVRKDLAKDGVKVDAEEFLNLHDDKSKAMRAITSSIDGYMWDDRVYIATGRQPRDLAATLVHEVNHVFNESEEHYATPKDALREEYRAFYCEDWVRTGKTPTKARCQEIKENVIRDYALKGVSPADIPDVPPGVLVPA